MLILLSVLGLGFAVYSNQKLSGLRQTLAGLQSQVGAWEVEDPSRVAIAAVPVSENAIPPGIETAYVWQYRMYLPANFASAYEQVMGRVKADSPGGKGSVKTGSSGPNSEPAHYIVTMALIEDDGQWFFCNQVGDRSCRYRMPSNFTLRSLDEFVVEPLLEENEVRVFDADEAICLFRLREKVLATDQRGNPEKDLYRGCCYYFFSRERRDAFDAWARGRRSSMDEAPP